MAIGLLSYLIELSPVFVIDLGKGACGGLAIIGVPPLALVTTPGRRRDYRGRCGLDHGLFAVRAFPMRTWSWPDIVWIAPGMVVGVGHRVLFFALVDQRAPILGIAIVTLVFAARFFLPGRFRPQTGAAVSPVKAVIFGFTTCVAYAAAPPLSAICWPAGCRRPCLPERWSRC